MSGTETTGAPQRIQLSRQRGYRKPPGAIVVSRPSKYGNPFVVGSVVTLSGTTADGLIFDGIRIRMTPAMATAAFRHEMTDRLTLADDDHPEDRAYVLGWRAALADLAGRDLACWCRLPAPGQPDYCHGAVWLELANPPITPHRRPPESRNR